MRKGEKNLLILIAVVVVVMMGVNFYRQLNVSSQEKGLPFYTVADADLQHKGSQLYRELECKNCHALWAVRNMMQNVPAPSLDGIGSIRSRQWIYDYLSSDRPQEILPSRLKKEYQMPSFAHLSDADRSTLADYLASLKVEDWYLEETLKAECRKLTGETC